MTTRIDPINPDPTNDHPKRWLYDKEHKERIYEGDLTYAGVKRYQEDDLKSWRPDLNEIYSQADEMRYLYATDFGTWLRLRLRKEFIKLYENDLSYESKLYLDVGGNLIQNNTMLVYQSGLLPALNWVEGFKRVAFIKRIEEKLRKYEMFEPIRYETRSAPEIKKAQDNLTDLFFREMQKKPVIPKVAKGGEGEED